MLKTRVVTALVLLTMLLLVVRSGSSLAFAIMTAVFFAASAWECLRLFGSRHPAIGAALWTIAFVWLIFFGRYDQGPLLPGFCVGVWALRLLPSLAMGLPPAGGVGNRLLTGIYGIAILGAFVSMLVLYNRSALYMVSVMAIVWLADIGAYFSGKAFGRHKLAPSISPGKSWEGALGGTLVVLATGMLTVVAGPNLADTFAVQLYVRWGWTGFLVVLIMMTVASVIGDLFESQLKRRAGMKDSSNLLPGHGGVLDRIDALIPTLPLAVLVGHWM